MDRRKLLCSAPFFVVPLRHTEEECFQATRGVVQMICFPRVAVCARISPQIWCVADLFVAFFPFAGKMLFLVSW